MIPRTTRIKDKLLGTRQSTRRRRSRGKRRRTYRKRVFEAATLATSAAAAAATAKQRRKNRVAEVTHRPPRSSLGHFPSHLRGILCIIDLSGRSVYHFPLTVTVTLHTDNLSRISPKVRSCRMKICRKIARRVIRAIHRLASASRLPPPSSSAGRPSPRRARRGGAAALVRLHTCAFVRFGFVRAHASQVT